MVSPSEMAREHCGQECPCCSIVGASRSRREDEPDAIGRDASLRQPGCSNGGQREDSIKQSFGVPQRLHAARCVACHGGGFQVLLSVTWSSPRAGPHCRGVVL